VFLCVHGISKDHSPRRYAELSLVLFTMILSKLSLRDSENDFRPSSGEAMLKGNDSNEIDIALKPYFVSAMGPSFAII
jgi:hypothetical protein